MNFKDLQFSYNKFKTDVQSQIAKNNPMQKQDTKTLSLWIFQERNDLATMRTMNYQRTETNKALKAWVKEEVEEEKIENGRDLEDLVGDKLTRLLDKQIEIEQEYANKFQQYRHAVKSIRDREEKLSDQREKKRSLQSRITNLSKTSPKSPKLYEFQKELKSLAQDTHESEMDLADFKRFALKEAFYLRFNTMNEYAEKTALIAGFGKYLTDLIDIEPTPATQQNRSPYDKGTEAAIIFADAMNAVNNWKPLAEDERPTLANMVNEEEPIGKGKGKENEADPVTPVTPAPPAAPAAPAAVVTAATEQAVATPAATDETPREGPPELPPRGPTMDSITPIQPTGYTAQEISNATGDHKTSQETEIDLDKIDLYDAPPPAYDGPPLPKPQSSPLNSDHAQSIHHQQQDNYTFSSPYQTNAPLPPAPQPSHQQSLHYSDSPSPMHLQTPVQQHHYYQHQDSTMYDPSNMMYNAQVNYQQLYRQVSQRRQQQQAYCRPYSEFQQQFNGGEQQQQPLRQRVDAGGFRIPNHQQNESAEDEKERLAQHYRQQEQQQQQQQYYSGGASQYGGSQYGGSQYGGLASVTPSIQQAAPALPIHHQVSQHSPNTATTAADPQAPQKPNNYEQKIAAEEEQ